MLDGCRCLNRSTKRASSKWWKYMVRCSQVEEVKEKGESSDTVRYYGLSMDDKIKYIKMTHHSLTGPPYDLFEEHLEGIITAFTETRQHFWAFQPRSWITYHNFTVLDIDGQGFFILCEKISHHLEIMFGEGTGPRSFVKEYRATGFPRQIERCFDQPTAPLTSSITVRQLIMWMDGPLRKRWEPYDILLSNCQHFASKLHKFVEKPILEDLECISEYPEEVCSVVAAKPELLERAPAVLRRDARFVSSAVGHNWRVLLYAPKELQRHRGVVLAAVAQEGRALQKVADELRKDYHVTLTAVRQNGMALQYASEKLRANPAIVLAAVKQNGDALQHAAEHLRSDRAFVLRAVAQNGMALPFVAEHLRRDRTIVLLAVRERGGALRHAARELQSDHEVVVAAGCQDFTALRYACTCCYGDQVPYEEV